jgi:DNA-binding CsgD family transcriptional regulator
MRTEIETAIYKALLERLVFASQTAPPPAVPATHTLNGSRSTAALALDLDLPRVGKVRIERGRGHGPSWQLTTKDGNALCSVEWLTGISGLVDEAWSTIQTLERVSGHASVMGKTLQALPLPTLVIDMDGTVLFQNNAAANALEAVPALRIDSDRLIVTAARRILSTGYLNELARRDGSCRKTANSIMIELSAPANGGKMMIQCTGLNTPFQEEEQRRPGPWLVTLYPDPRRRPLSSDAIRSLFGLTLTETRIAVALVAGRRPSEIARHRAVSYETVKKQLGRIFQKCDVTSQAQLIQLLSQEPFADPCVNQRPPISAQSGTKSARRTEINDSAVNTPRIVAAGSDSLRVSNARPAQLPSHIRYRDSVKPHTEATITP